MKRKFFIITAALALAAIFTINRPIANEKDIHLKAKSVTTKTAQEINPAADQVERAPTSLQKTSEESLKEIEAINTAEEISNKKDLSEEAEAFKELSELSSEKFIDDINAIAVFDKELAKELREDLNLKPSDLDDLLPEHAEQIEIDYDTFDIDL